MAVFHRGSTQRGLPAHVRHILGDRRHLSAHRQSVLEFAPDVVIDLILSSGAQAEEVMSVFRGSTKRLVAASSMDVYRACDVLQGFEPGQLEPVPLTEDSPLRTKLQTYPAHQVRELQQVFGWLDDQYDKIPVERAVLGDCELEGRVLRLPIVYGPGDHLHRLSPLLKRIDDGREKILLADDAAAWRSPRGFAENVAAAVVLVATTDHVPRHVYNIAEEPPLSELEWARRVAAQVGWEGEFVVLPRDRAPRHLRPTGNLEQHWDVSSSRIREELHYREPVPQDEALRRTIEWERAHPPLQIDPRQFDYASEDAALARLR